MANEDLSHKLDRVRKSLEYAKKKLEENEPEKALVQINEILSCYEDSRFNPEVK